MVAAPDTQHLLSSAALTAFKLNGQFLDIADHLARPAGLTAAWWQVLGAVLDNPRPVAGIAREMGITRQSVQRVADLIVERGLAEYHDNPAHKRAKLVALTERGRAAIGEITPGHTAFARRLAKAMGADALTDALAAMTNLSETLDALATQRSRSSSYRVVGRTQRADP